jgi:uncharacterized delta-60 repeat protein
MRGSVMVAFSEGRQSFGQPLYEIRINNTDTRDYQWSEANSLYSTYIFSGDTLTANIRDYGYGEIPAIALTLLEYTNDSVNGDQGVKVIPITGITGNNTSGFLQITNIPINPSPNCYDFIVVVTMTVTQGCAPIGILDGLDFYDASTCEIVTKNVGLFNPNGGSIYIGTERNGPNVTYSGATASGLIGPVFRVTPTYQLDPGFNSSTALGSSYRAINDIEIQNDGRVIVGGSQTTSTTGFSLNRLTTTGALDPTFTRYPFNGGIESVTDVVQQSDGKIIATGQFSQISGLTYNRYARFNYNGTIDNTYYSGGTSTGFSLGVNCEIDVRNDKVYYFGGFGNTFNGTTFGGLLRLNTNGQLDTTFNGTGRGGFDTTTGTGRVVSIKVLPDGKLLCTGVFNRYNGQPCPSGIVRLNENGTLDTTFNPGGAGFVSTNSVSLLNPTETLNQDENKYLILFDNFDATATYNGQLVPNEIFFLNLDGTLGDNTGLGTGFGIGFPKTCKLLSNGNYLITGFISSFNGTSITNGGMIQLSPTGQLQNC